MKKIIFMLLLGLSSIEGVEAQETASKNKFSPDNSLFEELTDMKKKTDKLNLYLNMQGSFDALFQRGFQEGKFSMNQLRIEAKGKLNHWLSYHYRQLLNRPNNGKGMVDNMPTSIDYAAIGIQLNQRAALMIGKHSAFFGGIEFDQNPIDVYQYSDMLENMECFLTGINFSYFLTPNHEINLQVMDNRSHSFEETYGITETEEGRSSDLKDTKLPLLYNINWNGNFNNVFKTRWSATVASQTKGHTMYYYALGNEIKLGKWYAYADLMYSQESIDHAGVITRIIGRPQGHNMTNASYFSTVAQCNYRFLPKWQACIKGMYETASVDKTTEFAAKGKYRTSYGYMASLEYFPMETNLHFFITYVGRTYNYTARSRALGHQNYDTHRLATGFIWKLPLF